MEVTLGRRYQKYSICDPQKVEECSLLYVTPFLIKISALRSRLTTAMAMKFIWISGIQLLSRHTCPPLLNWNNMLSAKAFQEKDVIKLFAASYVQIHLGLRGGFFHA